MMGMTQAELAKLAGISTTGLNNIERGTADPKASTLRSIQVAFEEKGILFVASGETSTAGDGVRFKG